MAFNPKTGLVYVNSWEIPRIMKYTKFEFVLNLKAAKALGLAISEAFLLRADEVIE